VFLMVSGDNLHGRRPRITATIFRSGSTFWDGRHGGAHGRRRRRDEDLALASGDAVARVKGLPGEGRAFDPGA